VQNPYGDFHKWGCPHSWMVYFMENPSINMDDDLGYPHDSGNLHISTGYIPELSSFPSEKNRTQLGDTSEN